MITFYKTVVQYDNQAIGIDTIHLSKVSQFYLHSHVYMFACVYLLMYFFIKFYTILSYVQGFVSAIALKLLNSQITTRILHIDFGELQPAFPLTTLPCQRPQIGSIWKLFSFSPLNILVRLFIAKGRLRTYINNERCFSFRNLARRID